MRTISKGSNDCRIHRKNFPTYKKIGSVKAQCWFLTLLIVVEGEKTPPKMLTHFHRAWADSRKLNPYPAGAWSGDTPQALKAPRRLPGPPAESEAPGTKIISLI
jgi:hypothetical protein